MLCFVPRHFWHFSFSSLLLGELVVECRRVAGWRNLDLTKKTGEINLWVGLFNIQYTSPSKLRRHHEREDHSPPAGGRGGVSED